MLLLEDWLGYNLINKKYLNFNKMKTMSMTKEQYFEEINKNEPEFIANYEYEYEQNKKVSNKVTELEFISDEEWQEYDEMMKEKLQDKFGRMTGMMKYHEFSKRNS
jgi:hypothetical protein